MALINYITKVHFDFGAVEQLPAELQLNAVRRLLIITDKGVEDAGITGAVTKHLAGLRSVAVFNGTPGNPTEAAARSALSVYREHDCDGIVAVGGGSPIDLAKSVAILVNHDAPLEQHAFNNVGIASFPSALPPVFAVPTTAGTGSEVGAASLMTFDSGRKAAIASPQLIPKASICDPELTLGLPPGLTAATGMDAISHCVETYLSPRINPPAEAIGLDGLRRGFANIERSVRDGSDRDARWNMMMAAMQGALCFQKGLGAVHAMSHPLGSLGLHHGTLNAILLPIVVEYNSAYVGDKFGQLRAAIGQAEGADAAGVFRELNRRLQIPASLRKLGVSEADLKGLAELSMIDGAHGTNPRPMQIEDYRKLYTAALG